MGEGNALCDGLVTSCPICARSFYTDGNVQTFPPRALAASTLRGADLLQRFAARGRDVRALAVLRGASIGASRGPVALQSTASSIAVRTVSSTRPTTVLAEGTLAAQPTP